MRGITALYYVDRLPNGTPARTNRKTGEVWVSLQHWNRLPFEHRLFILLHELGHIVNDSSDEFKADAFAADEYMKRGYSLTQSVYALSKVLSGRSKEHYLRIYQQLKRAEDYDFRHNGNTKAHQL